MSQAQPLINKLVVVGLGLIGGSLAAGLKRRGGCVETIGVVRTAEAGAQALKRGVVDRTCASLAEVAPELGPGDVVFISVPTLAVAGVLEQIRDCLGPQETRSEEHTSELQSRGHLVCRLLLEKKKIGVPIL